LFFNIFINDSYDVINHTVIFFLTTLKSAELLNHPCLLTFTVGLCTKLLFANFMNLDLSKTKAIALTRKSKIQIIGMFLEVLLYC
jgi:hypothetical protein